MEEKNSWPPTVNIDSEEMKHKKILELHRYMIRLEKLEITRQEGALDPEKFKEAYQDFFEHSKKLMLLVQDRLIVFIAPALAELLGFAREEMINTSAAFYVHPDELPRLTKYYHQRLSGQNAPLLYNTILKNRDGINILIEMRAGMIPYQGRPADFMIIKKL
jgi:PAS domain S-box-containing protein